MSESFLSLSLCFFCLVLFSWRRRNSVAICGAFVSQQLRNWATFYLPLGWDFLHGHGATMAHNHSKQSLANEQAASINKAIRTSYINKKNSQGPFKNNPQGTWENNANMFADDVHDALDSRGRFFFDNADSVLFYSPVVHCRGCRSTSSCTPSKLHSGARKRRRHRSASRHTASSWRHNLGWSMSNVTM
jgi:hypothetical protein